ncbi:MAG: glycosyl transferase [Firmicutes bacterium HGW-Firmicutes-14]|nr:MAG: glycosyl transferase [Firmicutes bacterium HGW-Firmicutes-14]
MKILHLSTTVLAQSAAYRLHNGLCSLGGDSLVLTGGVSVQDSHVQQPTSQKEIYLSLLRQKFDNLPLKLYPRRDVYPFSTAVVGEDVRAKISSLNPSLVHLHWICGGFLRIESLAKLNRPLVWTLHDSWAFTGGCHIPLECRRYRESCGRCPVLKSSNPGDLSNWVMARKKKAWNGLNPAVVTPSRWLAGCARASSLFSRYRVEVIPNGIDLNIYKPVEKMQARDTLGLPRDKKLILFGAVNSTSDPNKGFQFLEPALRRLSKSGWGEKARILVFGGREPSHKPDLGLPAVYFGTVYDEADLVTLYSAADAFVAPSMQENLPNTVMEALACGTPCVAFNIGGIPDLIKHEQNGYLARPFEPSDLAAGIAWVLSDDMRWDILARSARAKVEQDFALGKVAQQYLRLYSDILKQQKSLL